ncbi:MAG: hypothetical protein MRY63_08270 [Neomegalonema sp.]|nr:hypothetical protein [Neomegalonema sp.]
MEQNYRAMLSGVTAVFLAVLPSTVMAQEYTFPGQLDEWAELRDAVMAEIPETVTLTRDRSGIEPLATNSDARFLTLSIPVISDPYERRTGVFFSIGVGRDREMKDTNGKRLAYKVVASGRYEITGGAVAYVDLQSVTGWDPKGIGESEQQVKIGIRLDF